MEDQLITYETAILAKEKGFNIPVLYGVYGKKMKLTRNEDNRLEDWNKTSKQQTRSQSTSVPTQSLLQRWLREEHYIFTIVDVEEVELFTVSNWEYGEDLFKVKGKFKTYEEALEKGLQDALKLIN